MSPFPWGLNCSRPDPALPVLRGLLGPDVVGRVATIGHCPALADQPLLNIPTPDMTIGDNSAVAVGVDRSAADRRLGDKISQGQRASLPASPWRAVRLEAFLALLRGVDPMESYPLAVDFNRIGIDN